MLDFEWAKDKVMMGAEKKSMVITQKEKEMTAYHEAGHALCIMFTPGSDQLHKITIMPRGQALGMTTHLPEVDKYSMGMHEYEARICVCMGGKVAEELIYGPDKVSSGVAGVCGPFISDYTPFTDIHIGPSNSDTRRIFNGDALWHVS
jgi:ATP-dependent metalloprotease